MGKRRQARELALAVLFAHESRPDTPEAILEYRASELNSPPDVVEFARGLVTGVLEHQEELDQAIRAASEHWSLEQMSRMDKVILRIAVFEILFGGNVPVKAAINESIELAKAFSGDDSGRFVNGVLGRIAAAEPA